MLDDDVARVLSDGLVDVLLVMEGVASTAFSLRPDRTPALSTFGYPLGSARGFATTAIPPCRASLSDARRILNQKCCRRATILIYVRHSRKVT